MFDIWIVFNLVNMLNFIFQATTLPSWGWHAPSLCIVLYLFSPAKMVYSSEFHFYCSECSSVWLYPLCSSLYTLHMSLIRYDSTEFRCNSWTVPRVISIYQVCLTTGNHLWFRKLQCIMNKVKINHLHVATLMSDDPSTFEVQQDCVL